MKIRIFVSITLLLFLMTGCGVEWSQSSNKGSLSSTDNEIVFVRLTGGYWQLWTMKPDGSNLKQMTTSPSDKRFPVWSNEGNKIYFRKNNYRIFSIDTQILNETRLLATFGLVSDVVLFNESNDAIFVRYRTQLRDSGNIWFASLSDEQNRLITKDSGIQCYPDISRDDKQIAYISTKGYRTAEIYLTDIDGSNKKRLTENSARETFPKFSPSSDEIAYATDITGDYEIWLMNMDGNNRIQLTDSYGMDTTPCWSPDGQQIIFVSNRTGQLHLWKMDKDGTNLKQLTTGQPCMDPAWKDRKGN